MSVRGRGSLHTQLLTVLRSDADKEDSIFRNIRNRRWPERKGERPKNQDSQPDVLDLLPPPSLNLQRTSTLQLEVTACEKLFAGIIWILGWRYLSPERIFISVCQAPWGTTNLGPLLIHIQDLRFKTKRVTQTGLKILGGRGCVWIISSSLLPWRYNSLGYLCKEGEREFKQNSFPLPLWAVFGFWLWSPLLHKTTKTQLNLNKCYFWISECPHISTVASSAFLDFSLEINTSLTF